MASRLCHRYGPGRIPYASRRDVGGGIAMAATGLLATVLWFGGTGLLLAASAYVTGEPSATLGFVFALGLFFVPVAVPTSFVVGFVCWRYAYFGTNRQLWGAFVGLLTALASFGAGAIVFATLLAASTISGGEMALGDGVGFALVMTPIAFITALAAAGWLVVPVGMFGGWYHERAKVTP